MAGIMYAQVKFTQKLTKPDKPIAPKLDADGFPFLLLSPEDVANLYYIDWANFNMSEWTKKWNRAVAQ